MNWWGKTTEELAMEKAARMLGDTMKTRHISLLSSCMTDVPQEPVTIKELLRLRDELDRLGPPRVLVIGYTTHLTIHNGGFQGTLIDQLLDCKGNEKGVVVPAGIVTTLRRKMTEWLRDNPDIPASTVRWVDLQNQDGTEG